MLSRMNIIFVMFTELVRISTNVINSEIKGFA
jgi:hypothetical protein